MKFCKLNFSEKQLYPNIRNCGFTLKTETNLFAVLYLILSSLCNLIPSAPFYYENISALKIDQVKRSNNICYV